MIVAGDCATGQATIDAIHLLDQRFWRVVGDYRFAMQRKDGLFCITSLTFTLSEESGERDLTEEASRRVARRVGDDAPSAKARSSR